MLNGLRQRIAGLIAPGAKPIERSWEVGIPSFMGGGGAGNATLAGPAITPGTALSIAAVQRAINIYANTIGALDFYIAENDERGGRRPATGHPTYNAVHSRPNDISTSMRLRQALIGHVLTHGNGYLEIGWDKRRRHPITFHLMDPRDTKPEYRDGGTAVVYCQQSGPDLPAEDVIHIAMFGFDGLRGYSPITVARDTLSIASAQRTYQASLFGNGLHIHGHIETPGSAASYNSPQQAQKRDQLNEVHQGVYNAGKVMLLSGGAKWVQTAFSPQDAELILGCRFSVEEIARIFGLPPHMLGVMEGTNFASLEEQNIQFYQQSLLPFLVAIEQEFNNKIFGPIERYRYSVRHDVSTLLRGNTAAQRAQEDSDIASGVKSINEIRIARGDNPIDHPNADKHFIQANNNLIALEDLPESGKESPEPAGKLDPDTETEEDSTLKVTTETVEALRSTLADPIGRMVRAECEAVRKAAKRDRFDLWVDEFYPKHATRTALAIAPPLNVLISLGKAAKSEPHAIARGWEDASRRALRDLYTVLPPEDMPVAVERLCADWEANRTESLVSGLMGAKSP